MNKSIELTEACLISREFLNFVYGNLYCHSFSIFYATKENDKFLIKWEVKTPFNKESLFYWFRISSEGVVEKMELEGSKNEVH